MWEVLLPPLRGNFGEIDRLMGGLHPVSGRTPEAGDVPLRFTIDEMSTRPVTDAHDTVQGDAMPLAGFGESQASFEGAGSEGPGVSFGRVGLLDPPFFADPNEWRVETTRHSLGR